MPTNTPQHWDQLNCSHAPTSGAHRSYNYITTTVEPVGAISNGRVVANNSEEIKRVLPTACFLIPIQFGRPIVCSPEQNNIQSCERVRSITKSTNHIPNQDVQRLLGTSKAKTTNRHCTGAKKQTKLKYYQQSSLGKYQLTQFGPRQWQCSQLST
jgi:hypothetical protein